MVAVVPFSSLRMRKRRDKLGKRRIFVGRNHLMTPLQPPLGMT
jgi:hypothetical protein